MALKAYGWGGDVVSTGGLTPESPPEALMEFVLGLENTVMNLFQVMEYDVPDHTLSRDITSHEEVVPGSDGNDIRLIIYRPSERSESPVPAVIYFHGGGMVMLSVDNAMEIGWVEAIARTGLVAIAVNFRNAVTATGLNPFPAGLNDCAAAARWVCAHKDELGISKIVVHGESGGGNLALATALKANQEGWPEAVDGVVALAPYISGAYHQPDDWKLRELPSLVENNGYLQVISNEATNILRLLYDPSDTNAKNPLTWPYWATDEDLRGLPPHLIVTDELDMLRDEGNAYARKLSKAGVNVVGRVNVGTTHCAALIFRKALPGLFLHSLWELKGFADRL